MQYKSHLFTADGAPKHVRIIEDVPGSLFPITCQFLRAGQAPGYKDETGKHSIFRGEAVFCEISPYGNVTGFREADLATFALRGRPVQWEELEPRTRKGILNLYCALWETTSN